MSLWVPPEYEFYDNGSAPEFFVSHLREVQIQGGVARFVPVTIRKADNGRLVGTPPFIATLELDAGTAAAILTLKTLAGGLLPPAFRDLASRLRVLH